MVFLLGVVPMIEGEQMPAYVIQHLKCLLREGRMSPLAPIEVLSPERTKYILSRLPDVARELKKGRALVI